jgi:hypothetical protein
MAILNNSNAISSGGYDINNSVRLRSSASAYLSRTPAGAGSQTTWTWSGWVKLGALTASKGLFERFVSGSEFHTLAFRSAPGELLFYSYASPTDYGFDTNALFRDPSAWYHIVATFDTTNATATDRMRLYVNGIRQTIKTDYGSPPQNYVGGWNGATLQSIGRFQDASTFTDGYLADINFIDGQALTPSSFGETDTTTGSWKPKAYSGTYGTNGFYLKFSDIATTSGSNAGLGKDFSGNANYWNTNNISVTAGTTYDAMSDVPTLTSATVANYAVLNPLDKGTSGTLDRANLQWSSSASWQSARGTMTIPSGKFYFEGIITSTTSGSIGVNFGLATAANPLNVGGNSNTASYSVDATSSSNVLTAGSQSGSGSTFAAGDVLQYAIDRDNNKAWFGRNNTWYNSTLAATGDPVAGTNATWSSLPADLFPFINTYSQTVNFNFGQRPFAYTPPTGFVALNTYNLPDSTIKKGNTVMDATLYTGNGSTQTITNAAGFKPDFVWIKDRTTAYPNMLFDSVRGASKRLISNTTDTEATETDTQTSFNSNGFSVSTNLVVNRTSDAFVGWQWQAGQGSTSSNTSGSITSTVSVNTTAGFSIVTYTGTGANATVGHGLGVAPKMIIVKNRASGFGWPVYHVSYGNTGGPYLNGTNAAATASTWWNNTTPSSTVFTGGTSNEINASSNNYVAYCWAEIAGFSRFGSYVGNGSTDGPFIFTNFQPKFVMFKRTDSTGSWEIQDGTRSTYNEIAQELYANLSDAEYNDVSNNTDFLSNGFKPRNSTAGSNNNVSGGTYIYAAFASNPFKNSNAR